jgi:mRNA-degrading endonuclease RelE of RelBE toxin-antitoxin system
VSGYNTFKVRVKNSDKSSGKQGGYRIYYYKTDDAGITHLLVIYDKSEIEMIDESILDSLIDEV